MRTNGMTWHSVVRMVAARHGILDLTDEQCDSMLWERTSWPLGGMVGTVAALEREFDHTERPS